MQQNKKLKTFTIGKVYFGSSQPFELVTVKAYSDKESLNIAANYLRPNHLQTLTIVSCKE